MYKQSYSQRACFTIHAFKRSKEGSTKQPHCWTWVWQWGCHGPRFSQSHPERLNNARLCFAKDLYWRVSTDIKNKVEKSKNECGKNLHGFLALQRLRSGILRRDFGHSLCCSDLQSTTDRLGCCSPGGKHAKLIKHKAFGMPRLASGVFCSFRSGRRFFRNKPKARPGVSMRLVMPRFQQHFCWELKEALDSHPFNLRNSMLAGECYLKRSSPLSSRCLVGRTDWCFSLRNFRSEMIQHWFYLPWFHDQVKGSKRWCQKQKSQDA